MYGGVSRVAFEAFKTRRDTFVSGRYRQHGSTGKHAAIYLGQDASGIQVMDQWNSQNQVRQRTIYWHPHSGGLSNDANAFSVIEW
ncbi:BPSL0067 family protein [Paraburkholderia sp. BR10954]|uniref:BPSL0067 family protein n=1 Tax=Paraburkholderia sp. BR10954 TaxID=3236995 RepID=UPI0034D34CBF